MKNSTYWKGRFELLEQAANQAGTSFYQSTESQYYQAQRTIEGQISAWYQRFAVNNKISMDEARKLLTTKELSEFKWDVQEYIKYGEQNALDAVWMQQLENASARYHISRLEALKYQTQQSMEVLFGNQMDGLDTLVKQIYSDGYYHTAFEIQKGFGVGWNVASIDQNRFEKIISKPWAADGKNFSDRIWTNKTKLTNELHTELTQMCMLGKAPDTAIKNIAKNMNTSRVNAGRLVMTESAYFASVSQKDAFNELDIEQFEIVATLDSHTSAICQDLDGHVYDMKDYEPGVTAPPFHVWCRSTTVPYFDDEFNVGERAARGEDGKTYYVSDSMKYPDWKKSLVDGDTDGLQEADATDIMKEKPKQAFVPATTKADAMDWCKRTFGIDGDYSKYHIDSANAVNEGLLRIQETFGAKCFDKLKSVGTFPKGYSTSWAGAYAPSKEALWLRNVSNKDCLGKLKAVAESQKRIGHWSTGDAMHTIYHEIGHAVSRAIEVEKSTESMTRFQRIEALRKSIQNEVFQKKGGTAMYADYLSKYGMTNMNEFIAESVAEYMVGNPRDTAKQVVDLLTKELDMKGGFK